MSLILSYISLLFLEKNGTHISKKSNTNRVAYMRTHDDSFYIIIYLFNILTSVL